MDRPEDRLALATVLDRDGRALRSLDVHAWPLTIGRALDQHLVLDDTTVAARHATLAPNPAGELELSIGASVNGAWLNGQHLAAGARHVLPASACRLQLGHTTVLLRQRGEILAPEQPLPAHLLRGTRSAAAAGAAGVAGGTRAGWHWPLWQPGRQLGLVAALVLAALVIKQGLSMDPGADFTAWLPALVGLPAAVAAWCATWALLSKLFQHRFEFMAHLHIALPGLLAIEVLDTVLPALAAALGWPLLWRLTPVLRVLLMAWVVYRHLALLMPHQPQRAAAALVSATVVGSAISLAFTHRSTDRFSAPAYMSTLPLPAFNLTRAEPAAQLVQDLTPLAARLEKRVAQAHDENPAEGDDGE